MHPEKKDDIARDLAEVTARLGNDQFGFEPESGVQESGSRQPEQITSVPPDTVLKTDNVGPAPDLPPRLMDAVARKTAAGADAGRMSGKMTLGPGDVPPGLADALPGNAARAAVIKTRSSRWRYLVLGGLGSVACLAGLLVYLFFSMPSFKQGGSFGMRSVGVPPPEFAAQTDAGGVNAGVTGNIRDTSPHAVAAVPTAGNTGQTAEKDAAAADPAGTGEEQQSADGLAASGSGDGAVAESEPTGSATNAGLIGRGGADAPVEYYLYSGYESEKNGNPAQALFYYKKAAAAHPADCKLLNKIGALLITLELYEEAAPYLQDALGEKQDYSPALINLGVLAARTGRPEDAQRHLADAIGLDSTNRDALYTMMQLCRMQGDYTRAGSYRAKLQSLGVSVGQ